MTSAKGNGISPALSVRHLSKRFGGGLVLNEVDFSVLPGEVHGLLGQNGSGKSTLIKILAGFHAPESGAQLEIHGKPVSFPLSPADPRRLGIAFVHQHLGLIPSLTVLENLRLSRFSTESNLALSWKAEQREATALFERFGLSLDTSVPVASLNQTQRAMLAIVRAFDDMHASEEGAKRGIMILDEPTPFLPRAGVEQLFDLIRSITVEGASVIFVSHDIDEICEITDRATILRDGIVAGTINSAGTSHETFVEHIVGDRVEYFQAEPRTVDDKAFSIRVSGLSGKAAREVNIDLCPGEIVGLTGLIGSGFDEVPDLIFGAQQATAGLIEIEGRQLEASQMTADRAIASGFALLPSDRLGRSGVGRLSVMENQSLPVLSRFFRNFHLHWPEIRSTSQRLNELLDVRPRIPGLPDMDLQSLSGGNQQKVLLAKWLQIEPSLLLLDEPTQGVDVGARQTLLTELGKAAAAGTCIICASTDAEQLAQICSRVLIFSRGRIVHELTGTEITKNSITERCLLSGSMTSTANQLERAI